MEAADLCQTNRFSVFSWGNSNTATAAAAESAATAADLYQMTSVPSEAIAGGLG